MSTQALTVPQQGKAKSYHGQLPPFQQNWQRVGSATQRHPSLNPPAADAGVKLYQWLFNQILLHVSAIPGAKLFTSTLGLAFIAASSSASDVALLTCSYTKMFLAMVIRGDWDLYGLLDESTCSNHDQFYHKVPQNCCGSVTGLLHRHS